MRNRNARRRTIALRWTEFPLEERCLLSGLTASLVKDINLIDASPSHLTALNGKLYFLTSSQAAGKESLWASDGTTSGTVELMSSSSFGYEKNGAAYSGLNHIQFIADGGKVFFTAQDSKGTPALFSTDGTAAGTAEVTSLSAPAHELTAVGGKLFFTEYVNDPSVVNQTDNELWASDGTASGTIELTSAPSMTSSYDFGMNAIDHLAAVGGSVGFLDKGELWISDGTKSGTVPLTSSGTTGVRFYEANALFPVGGKLFLVGQDSHGNGLWTSDGTTAGTVAVKDFGQNEGYLYIDGIIGGTVYFFDSSSNQKGQLWSSDGTVAGTVQLTNVSGGLSPPKSLTSVGGTVYFVADNKLWSMSGGQASVVAPGLTWKSGPFGPTALNATTLLFWADGGNGDGTELWETDGTASGTVMVKDINPGPGSSYIPGSYNGPEAVGFSPINGTGSTDPEGLNHLVVIGGVAYFGAVDGIHGDELWKTDGTAAGTSLVKDIDPDTAGSDPQWLTDLNGALVFVGHDGGGSNQLWKSDGTAAGTSPIMSFTPAQTQSAAPRNLIVVGGTLYFTADDGIDGDQLWKSDGTASGTTMVTDVAPSGASNGITDLLNLNGTLLFKDGDTLYRSDGTMSGTSPIFTLPPSSTFGSSWNVARNHLLFWTTPASGGTGTAELWASDGTASGTQEIVSLPNGTSYAPYVGVNMGGTVFFDLSGNSSPDQLWASDGTAAGTREITTLVGSWGNPAAFGNRIVFTDSDSSGKGEALWISDGTAAGTVQVRDFPSMGSGSNTTSYSLDNLNVAGGLVYITVTKGKDKQLWRSDGTAAGTIQLTSAGAGQGGVNPYYLCTLNGLLLFLGKDPANGEEALWSTNGTVSGTSLVTDLGPSSSNYAPVDGAIVLGKTALFSWTSSATSSGQLWSTDGTAGGTTHIGPGLSNAGNFTPDVNILFFTAQDNHGQQLWSGTFQANSPTPTPTPTATPAVAVGQQPVFHRKLNRKGKAVGKPVVAGFTLDFNVPLDAAAASNPAHYQVDTLTTGRVKGKVKHILHPITNFTVSYAAASDAVTITFAGKETFRTGGQITVLGGVTTASGGPLGGPTVFTISPGGTRIEPS
jgi:ELWxxDGT repeat protein